MIFAVLDRPLIQH